MYLRLQSHLPEIHSAAVKEVVAAWNAQGAKIVFWPHGVLDRENRVHRIRFCPANTFAKDWVAVQRPTRKEILLNERYHWSTKPQWWKIFRPTQLDIRQVLAHEIGHALGLAHSEQPGSIMNEWEGYFGKWKGIQDRVEG